MPILPIGCLANRIFTPAIDLKSNESRDFAYRGGMEVVLGGDAWHPHWDTC
ncbi:MAG: hypothetical protein ACR2OA_17720 [Rubripirellula sp.]